MLGKAFGGGITHFDHVVHDDRNMIHITFPVKTGYVLVIHHISI